MSSLKLRLNRRKHARAEVHRAGRLSHGSSVDVPIARVVPRAAHVSLVVCLDRDHESDERLPVRLSIEKKPGADWFPAPSYSTDLAAAWAILDGVGGLIVKHWLDAKPDTKCEAHIHNYDGNWVSFAPSIAVAALRCYVGWTLGDMVQVPQELLLH